MDALASHPKFKDVKDECLCFPEHAEHLFQVYLDLLVAKEFLDVSLIKSPLLGRHFIAGTHPDTGERYMFLPAHMSEPWSPAKMDSMFLKLGDEQDQRLKDGAVARITLAIITGDSTLTYVNMRRGIPPEANPKAATTSGGPGSGDGNNGGNSSSNSNSSTATCP